MIFINIDPQTAYTYDRDKLSILAANNGVIVDEITKTGLYLDDDFHIIYPNKNYKQIQAKRKRAIIKKENLEFKKVLCNLSNKSINSLDVFLQAVRPHLKNYKCSRNSMVFTDEEKKYILKVFMNYKKDLFVLKHMAPKKAFEFLKNYTNSDNLKGYNKISEHYKQKLRKNFNTIKIAGIRFYETKQVKEIEEVINAILQKKQANKKV